MRVGIIEVGANTVKYKEIEDSLNSYQNIVGGLIEYIPLSEELAIYCNEEGKLMDLPPSAELLVENEMRDVIAGDCIIIGGDGEGGNASLTLDDERVISENITYNDDMGIIQIELSKF